ncbi:hypothetical protein AB0D57_14935 [Streptomyces sp. NPDC048275]|uniref:hypothetical protein n=1 Tax=Streptomyces sp. NPDC048275 TaxID=3155629 RepID=UPI0033F5ACA9
MTTTHSFQFEGQGNSARVTVDGVDVSSAVTAVTVHANAWDRPRVTLELSVHDVTRISSPETELLIPESTAKALVALGWAPPAEEEGRT